MRPIASLLTSLALLSLAAHAHAQSAPAERGVTPPGTVVGVPSASGSGAPAAGRPTGAWAPITAAPLEDEAASTAAASTSTNWALVAPGIGLLAGGWLIGWLTTGIWNLASANCSSGSSGGSLISTPTLSCAPPSGPYGEGWWQMAIPLVGPWLTFVGDDTFRGDDVWFPALIGVMQPIGLGLLIAGLATPRTAPARSARTTLEVVPTASGLMLRGAF